MHQLVMPSFNCCSAVWGNINKELADKLQKMQIEKRAASLILHTILRKTMYVKAIQVRV